MKSSCSPPDAGNPPYDPDNPGHRASNAVTFHYVDDARDNLTINPALGDKGGGESVGIKVTGLTFTAGDVAGTKVTFGDEEAQVTRVTQDTITVVTPKNNPKRVDVTVEHGGRTFVLKKGFRYMNRPRVRTITPARASTAGGEKVIIDGFDFLDGGTEVWLDNARVLAGRVKVIDRRTIQLTAPPRTVARALQSNGQNPRPQGDLFVPAEDLHLLRRRGRSIR